MKDAFTSEEEEEEEEQAEEQLILEKHDFAHRVMRTDANSLLAPKCIPFESSCGSGARACICAHLCLDLASALGRCNHLPDGKGCGAHGGHMVIWHESAAR